MHIPQNILDLVLPRFCVGCLSEGTWLCNTCLGIIQIPREQRCPFCETVTPAGRSCDDHQGSALSGCLALGYYHDPILRDALHRYKYEYAEELAAPLTNHFGRMAEKFHATLPAKAIIVPIPLSTSKLRERGFNQTIPLAATVANTLALSIVPTAIERTRNTPPQAQLSNAERANNLNGAFRVNHPNIIHNRTILLIDDVLSTGATMEAAARVLKAAGANAIFGLVLARG